MAQDTSRRVRNMTALGGAVLLGTTFLTAPVSAQSVDELRSQIDALQQRLDQIETRQVASPVVAPAQAVTAGDFPGAIKLPGTNTSFKVGGYVKFDYHYSTQQGLGDSFAVGGIPVPGSLGAAEFSNGHSRMHARQTRFNIQTRTPSDLGEIKTYIEGDFFGAGGNELVSNSTSLRLRHAYGTIGNLLVGQTWGTFMHLGSLADTIDFAGPAGVWFTRQAQIRYTIPFSGGWKIDLAVENPQSAALVNTTTAGGAAVFTGFGPGGFVGSGLGGAGQQEDRIPDFVAKVTFAGDWGFVSLAGLLGAHDINAGAATFTTLTGTTTQLDDTELFWALHAGARISTWGKDSIYGNIAYTEGGGRTLYPFGPAAYIDLTGTTPSVEGIDIFGAAIGYEHWWTDNLYSNLVYGITDFDYPGGLMAPVFLGFSETQQTVHANLWWAPVPRVRLGIEYIWGENEYNVAPGADDDNTAQRFHFGAQFSF